MVSPTMLRISHLPNSTGHLHTNLDDIRVPTDSEWHQTLRDFQIEPMPDAKPWPAEQGGETAPIDLSAKYRSTVSSSSKLPEDRRKQLDGIVQQMTAKSESEVSIRAVVNDFKQKYSEPKRQPPKDAWETVAETVAEGDGRGGLFLLNSHSLLKGNRDRITSVHLYAADTVLGIQLSTGESIERVEAPRLTAYLAILIYPVLGFLIPFGCIRVLSWVGAGFVAPPQ
jgi:hypothetical protein